MTKNFPILACFLSLNLPILNFQVIRLKVFSAGDIKKLRSEDNEKDLVLFFGIFGILGISAKFSIPGFSLTNY